MSLLKISVCRDPWAPPGKPWLMSCAYCDARARYFTWWGAQDAADTHAADPCDGIVLARLLDRLRYRREGYDRARRVNLDRGDLHTAAAYRMVVSNIDHDIRMAAR